MRTFILPAYFAPALINDDYSGLQPKEIEEIKTFEAKEDLQVIGCSDEPFFKWSNDANNLGCDCLEFYSY